MNVVFTICSNNYLGQAKVLRDSLKHYDQHTIFYIFLCDEKIKEIDYRILADEVFAVAEIEPGIGELAARYNIIELNTCIKPRVIEYLFAEKNAGKVIYLDPDIKMFDGLSGIFKQLDHSCILLTPHILTPVAIDHKTPGENTFLNFGLYNLGFIAIRNHKESYKFISWWKEHTYKQGYIDTNKGIFVDQLPVSLAPLFFSNIEILRDKGLNMAPWNLHERYLTEKDGSFFVNDLEKLTFYHFSSFVIDSNELPLMHYDRFKLADRPDLQKIYNDYNTELKTAGHAFYTRFKSIYTGMREASLNLQKKQKWVRKLGLKKLFGTSRKTNR